MVHCCIPGCKNTHHNKSKKDEWSGQDTRNYSLHDLPSEDRMDIRELWVMAIHRSSLPKDVAVCSDHFTEDCFDEKWEEYKRKYGPTKVKRKLKLDAVPTIFPGRIFIHDKVQRIRENWKNKELQKQLELERLRIEREYKDRFKLTQTECTCKCRCKLRKKNFSQQVNFQFKFMKDVGVQFPKDLTQTVKDDHSYTQGKSRSNKTNTLGKTITNSITAMPISNPTNSFNSAVIVDTTISPSDLTTQTVNDGVVNNDDELANSIDGIRTTFDEGIGIIENGDQEIEYNAKHGVIVVNDIAVGTDDPFLPKRVKLDDFITGNTNCS